MKTELQGLVEQLEAAPTLPPGSDERFNGYAGMGVPFMSGHILAMRRFAVTSIGPGYTSVWHRNPAGEWFFYTTSPARQSCPRYFGVMASDFVQTDVQIKWEAANRLRILVPSIPLDWEVNMKLTLATRMMNLMAGLLPEAAWHNTTFLSAMGLMAGPMLGVGHVRLAGNVPNGQSFIANPRLIWAITDSHATLAGEDLGLPGPVKPQAHLADFWIPQQGLFAIGESYFETFDPSRHSAVITGAKLVAS
ncbi:MAG: hypothetical protein WAM09_14395 [Anaerolineales bacterium]